MLRIWEKLRRKLGRTFSTVRRAEIQLPAPARWEARVAQLNLKAQGYFIPPAVEQQVKAALRTKPVAGAFLAGPPGSGKTHLAEVVAQALGCPLLVQQLFPGSTEETLFVRLLPDQKGEIKAVDGVLVEAARRLGALPGPYPIAPCVVLLLDEWDKSRPSADGMLLDFLQTGRIRFGDIVTQVPLDRLIVFLTTNEEREISEPLRRRLCRIELSPLSPQIIQSLLAKSHPGHPLLPLTLRLYELSLHSRMPRPFSIQELRQFLDAIPTPLPPDFSNDRLDTFVYQFLTKSREVHALLHTLLEESGESDEAKEAQRNLPTPPEYLQLIRSWRKNSLLELAEDLPLLSEEQVQKWRRQAYGVFKMNEETWKVIQDITDFNPISKKGRFDGGFFAKTDNGPQIFLTKPLAWKHLSLFMAEEKKGTWGEIALRFPTPKGALHDPLCRKAVAKILTQIFGLLPVQSYPGGMVFSGKGMRLWVGASYSELLLAVPFDPEFPPELLPLVLRDAGNPYWLRLAQDQSWDELSAEVKPFLEALPFPPSDDLPAWGAAFPLPKGQWGFVHLTPDHTGRLYLPAKLLRDDSGLRLLGENMNKDWGYRCPLNGHRVRSIQKDTPEATLSVLVEAVEYFYSWVLRRAR